MTASDPEQANFACQAWATEQIRLHCGLAPTEFSLVKARPWSTVWKVSTPAKAYFLKACGPGFELEAHLLPWLTSEFADVAPQIIAYDHRSSWLLTQDAGQSLLEVIARDKDEGLHYLRATLKAYARMQLEISKGASQVRRGHLPDNSLDVLPSSLHLALSDTEMLKLGGATEETIARRALAIEQCGDLCKRLASFDLPHSIEHGDLHPNNIMVDAGATRITDWGDATWSHPFCSMAICLDMSRRAFGAEFSHENRVLSAYLDVWQSMVASEASLREALALAIALRPVQGILLWKRAYNAMRDDARKTAAGYVVDWLLAFEC